MQPDFANILVNAFNTKSIIKILQKQIYTPDLAFGAKNRILIRNTVNTPPSLPDLNFLEREHLHQI